MGGKACRPRPACYVHGPVSTYLKVRNVIKRAVGSFSRYQDLDTLYDPAGATALDFGWAGDGIRARELVERGATRVVGFDLWWKQEDIARVTALAQEAGVADRVEFCLADPYVTGFEDNSFDLIVGHYILSHLELERVLEEIRRLLKPGGRAVFAETLAGNPFLRLGRQLTRRVESEPGRPLTEADWALCARYFPGFEHLERELTTIPLMPLNLFLPAGAQRRIAGFAWNLDERLMKRFPRLRRYARLTFLILK
jgi:SAM-dependent methyltransferase